MSPETNLALESGRLASQEIQSLKRRGVQERDMAAALTLIDLAIEATVAAHSLWSEQPAPSPLNPFGKRGKTPSRSEWRELLVFYLGAARPFPVLHFWGSEKARSILSADQDEILHALEFGPTELRGHKDASLRGFLKLVLEQFLEIQSQATKPKGLKGTIWKLPPLELKSARQYHHAIVHWLWANPSTRVRLRTQGSDLYLLANPERKLANRRLEKTDRLNAKVAKWKEEDGAELGWNNATKLDVEMRKISKMKVTDGDIRNGLKDTILSYLRRNLVR